MTKRQRQFLCDLREIINEAGMYRFGMDGDSIHQAFAMARAYKDIEKVLFGVLTDDPENEYRDEDVQEAECALKRLQESLNIKL